MPTHPYGMLWDNVGRGRCIAQIPCGQCAGVGMPSSEEAEKQNAIPLAPQQGQRCTLSTRIQACAPVVSLVEAAVEFQFSLLQEYVQAKYHRLLVTSLYTPGD